MSEHTTTELADMICRKEFAPVEAELKINPTHATGLTDFTHSTLLHFAAEAGNEKLIKLLVELGADVNARNDRGETPLIRAVVENDRSKPVKTLLDLGADPNLAGNDGKTPIYWAAAAQMGSMTKLLKKAGATIDIFTELCLSSPGKIYKKLKANPALLAQVLDIEAFAFEASRNGEEELLLLLLESGLNPNACESHHRNRTLLIAMLYDRISVKVLDAFLAQGADPNQPHTSDWPITITHYIRHMLNQRHADDEWACDLNNLWVRYYHRLLAAGGKLPEEVDPWKKGLERGGLAGENA